jgi:hypothetical protein
VHVPESEPRHGNGYGRNECARCEGESGASELSDTASCKGRFGSSVRGQFDRESVSERMRRRVVRTEKQEKGRVEFSSRFAT